jgi:hypothetical protein
MKSKRLGKPRGKSQTKAAHSNGEARGEERVGEHVGIRKAGERGKGARGNKRFVRGAGTMKSRTRKAKRKAKR